jgi:hypothetical protein
MRPEGVHMRPIKVKKIGVICGCFKKLAIIPNLPNSDKAKLLPQKIEFDIDIF